MLWPPDVKCQLTGKDLDAGKDSRQEEKGTTEDVMFGWHHVHIQTKMVMIEQALGVAKEQKPGVLQAMGLPRVRHN